MAENPNQWGKATRVIAEALIDYTKELSERREGGGLQRDDFRVGPSGPFRIAKALADAGFLDHDDVWIEDPSPRG